MVEIIHVPNLKEILKPVASHKFGYGIKTETGKFYKQDILEQGSTPEDKNILKKLGLKRNEKILAIAGYYASWASALKKAGVRVDYSDISESMVAWAKKEYKKLFGKYIHSNYELIPKNPKEYDWTFTFEACGGKRGLPIAYQRSLLNTKGGILVLLLREYAPEKMGSKLKQYELIVKTLAKIYGAESSVKKIKIISHIKGKTTASNPHMIYRIMTNNSARKKVELDLKVLGYFENKKIVDLEKDSEKLEIKTQELKTSLTRLNKLSSLIKEEGCLKKLR